jgi:hypothetical protein
MNAQTKEAFLKEKEGYGFDVWQLLSLPPRKSFQ